MISTAQPFALRDVRLLVIASELSWKEKGLTIRQQTDFPRSDTTRFSFSAEAPTEMTLRVRCPGWLSGALSLRVNGQPQQVRGEHGGYAAVRRVWHSGDTVEVQLPMSLHLEAMPDDAQRVALLYGPIVLAGALGSPDEPMPRIPVLVAEGQPLSQWIEPVEGEPLRFQSHNVGRPQEVPLRPFYETHGQRYSVYFDVFSQPEWEEHEARYRAEEARRKELEARTIDFFQPGEMQPERDHSLQSESSSAGEAMGRKCRYTWNGGWFSFELQVLAGAPQDLILTYSGGEANPRTFDILLDNHKIATQTLHLNEPGRLFDVAHPDVAHPLGPDVTRGKSKISVRLQAPPDSMAGALFGARIVRRAATQGTPPPSA